RQCVGVVPRLVRPDVLPAPGVGQSTRARRRSAACGPWRVGPVSRVVLTTLSRERTAGADTGFVDGQYRVPGGGRRVRSPGAWGGRGVAPDAGRCGLRAQPRQLRPRAGPRTMRAARRPPTMRWLPPRLRYGSHLRQSVVLREAEVDPAVRRVEPPAGDHLGPGEEVHRVGTVGVRVAEQRVLPA